MDRLTSARLGGQTRHSGWATEIGSIAPSQPGDKRPWARGPPIPMYYCQRSRNHQGKGRLRAAGLGGSFPSDPGSRGEGSTEGCPILRSCSLGGPGGSEPVSRSVSRSLCSSPFSPLGASRDSRLQNPEKEALEALFPHSAVPPVASAPDIARETEAQREWVSPRVRGKAGQDPGPHVLCCADTPLSGEKELAPHFTVLEQGARPWLV